MVKFLNILLQKNNTSISWGFDVRGGSDLNSPVVITEVVPGSISSQYLSKGDQITQIDSMDTKYLSQSEIKNLITKPKKSLDMVILKNATTADAEKLSKNDIYKRTNSERGFRSMLDEDLLLSKEIDQKYSRKFSDDEKISKGRFTDYSSKYSKSDSQSSYEETMYEEMLKSDGLSFDKIVKKSVENSFEKYGKSRLGSFSSDLEELSKKSDSKEFRKKEEKLGQDFENSFLKIRKSFSPLDKSFVSEKSFLSSEKSFQSEKSFLPSEKSFISERSFPSSRRTFSPSERSFRSSSGRAFSPSEKYFSNESGIFDDDKYSKDSFVSSRKEMMSSGGNKSFLKDENILKTKESVIDSVSMKFNEVYLKNNEEEKYSFHEENSGISSRKSNDQSYFKEKKDYTEKTISSDSPSSSGVWSFYTPKSYSDFQSKINVDNLTSKFPRSQKFESEKYESYTKTENSTKLRKSSETFDKKEFR